MSLLPPSDSKKNQPNFLPFIVAFVAFDVVVLGALVWAGLREGPPPTVTIASNLPAVGQKTQIHIDVSEPVRGISAVKVEVSGSALPTPQVLAEAAHEPVPWTKPWAKPTDTAAAIDVVVGKSVMPNLVPGTLVVKVTAGRAGTWLKSPEPVVVEKTYDVQLDPPSIAASSSFIHPTQGGAEVVVYDVGPSSSQDGVQVGDWFFRGFPLPGGAPSQHFAIFGVPYDLDVSEEDAKGKILLVAEDALGNRAEARFIHKYFPRPMGKDTIELKDAFLQKVTGEIFARTPALQKQGSLLADYLLLNGELRKQNNAKLRVLAQKTASQFLWKQTFAPMQNAAVKGAFADRRTYRYQDKDVDQQDHLGFDLASLEHAPVTAANDGVVVFAGYFGIFGNCVVVDHGYGLQTLYAHLSTLSVQEGATVVRGGELGRTGNTGLAGGDHLHFTTLVGGLPVNPIEWWDGHWIQDRVKLKLGTALSWSPDATR